MMPREHGIFQIMSTGCLPVPDGQRRRPKLRGAGLDPPPEPNLLPEDGGDDPPPPPEPKRLPEGSDSDP
jgi:hypothetical protein